MTATAIGIDLGGTNLRVCLVNAGGQRLAEDFRPLPCHVDADGIVQFLSERAAHVGSAARPVGIGLGLGGALDSRDQLVPGMTNRPSLAGCDLAIALERATGLPCRLENDARAAMLGEARFGRARGVHNALMLTLGTGVGGGLLLDGRVRVGPHRLAGEIGLSLVPAAGAARWQRLEDAAAPGGLWRTQGLDMAAVVQRATAGEPTAEAELDKVAEVLAVAIVNAHVTLDLEMVLLSGGLTRAGPVLLAAIRRVVHKLCPPALAPHLNIAYADLGEWAGAMGAAALWLAPDA